MNNKTRLGFNQYNLYRENQRKLEENMKIDEERKAKEKESSRFGSSSYGISSFASRFRR